MSVVRTVIAEHSLARTLASVILIPIGFVFLLFLGSLARSTKLFKFRTTKLQFVCPVHGLARLNLATE